MQTQNSLISSSETIREYRVGFAWCRDRGGRWLDEGRENIHIKAVSEADAIAKAPQYFAKMKMGRLQMHYAIRWWALPMCATCSKTERDCPCRV